MILRSRSHRFSRLNLQRQSNQRRRNRNHHNQPLLKSFRRLRDRPRLLNQRRFHRRLLCPSPKIRQPRPLGRHSRQLHSKGRHLPPLKFSHLRLTRRTLQHSNRRHRLKSVTEPDDQTTAPATPPPEPLPSASPPESSATASPPKSSALPSPLEASVRPAPPPAQAAQQPSAERRDNTAEHHRQEELRQRKRQEAEARKREQVEEAKEKAQAEARRKRQAAAQGSTQPQAHQIASPGSASNLGDYRSSVLHRLASFKQYPESARAHGAEGETVVSFTLDNAGRVVSARITRSSGQAEIDAETLAMVRRASPFPPPPSAAARSFSVPIEFHLD